VAALIFHLSSLPDDGCEIEQSVLLGVRFGFRPFQSSPSSSSFFPFAFSLIDDESTFANGLARPGGSARCYEPIWRRSAKTGDYKFEPKKKSTASVACNQEIVALDFARSRRRRFYDLVE